MIFATRSEDCFGWSEWSILEKKVTWKTPPPLELCSARSENYYFRISDHFHGKIIWLWESSQTVDFNEGFTVRRPKSIYRQYFQNSTSSILWLVWGEKVTAFPIWVWQRDFVQKLKNFCFRAIWVGEKHLKYIDDMVHFQWQQDVKILNKKVVHGKMRSFRIILHTVKT